MTMAENATRQPNYPYQINGDKTMTQPTPPLRCHDAEACALGQRPGPSPAACGCAPQPQALRIAALLRERLGDNAAADLLEQQHVRVAELERWQEGVRDGSALLNRAECAEAQVAELEAQAQDVQPIVLDDTWKRSMLDGRALVRDEMGCGDHPALPVLEEGMKPVQFFDALGIELIGSMAESQMDADAYEAMIEACDSRAWTPKAPDSEGWLLVSIFETEDGPAAWWIREAVPAKPERKSRKAAAPAQEHATPVLYVSPEQLVNLRDPEGAENAEAGRYLPARKTQAGKFTQPLYAHWPAAQAQDVQQDAVRLDCLDSHSEGVIRLDAVPSYIHWGPHWEHKTARAAIDAASAAQGGA